MIDIINKRDDIYIDENYKKLYDSFYSLFNRHGRNKKDTFDYQVWFLTNHENKTENSHTPKEPKKLFEILSEINLDKFKSQNKSLKVNVDTFIYKISECLIDYNRLINRSKENIKKYNIDDETNLIPITLELLKKRIDLSSQSINNSISSKNFNKIESNSKVNFSITKVENFPQGEYEFRILIKEVDLSENCKEKEFYLNLNEKIKISEENQTIINPKKFSQYEFSFCDEVLYNKYPSIGSTFLTYQIICERADMKFVKKILKSSVKPFLDFLLGNIAEVRNLVKNTITKSCLIKVNNDDEDYLITLDFSVQLDDLTRMEILNRLNLLFKEVLKTKSENEKKIDELLEFFPEIENEVKSIFEMNDVIKEQRGPCCECKIC